MEAGFAKIFDLLPGSGGARSERWDGDRLSFSVAAMGQTVARVVTVLDNAVKMEVELPGVVGMIANGLKDRLQKVGQLLLTKSSAGSLASWALANTADPNRFSAKALGHSSSQAAIAPCLSSLAPARVASSSCRRRLRWAAQAQQD